jgi:hypothetical protein
MKTVGIIILFKMIKLTNTVRVMIIMRIALINNTFQKKKAFTDFVNIELTAKDQKI